MVKIRVLFLLLNWIYISNPATFLIYPAFYYCFIVILILVQNWIVESFFNWFAIFETQHHCMFTKDEAREKIGGLVKRFT